MTLVKLESLQGVALVKLANGVTNPLSPSLVTQLEGVLEQVESDGAFSALVLTSDSQKFFSLGLDIPSLYPLNKEEFLEFYRSFNRTALRLLTLGMPTLCAITGHATAGGCILALMCDYRYMAQGRKWIGLNEIKLGVPVPYLAHCVLRAVCGERVATEITYSGEFLDPEGALKVGLVDAVVPPESLLERALDKVQSLAGFYAPAFRAIKENRVAPLRESFQQGREQDERLFGEFWFREEVRRGLQEAMKKF